MKYVKLASLTFISICLGFVGGLYSYEKLSLQTTRDLEIKILEFEKLKVDIDEFNLQGDYVEALDYLNMLLYIDANNLSKVREELIDKLARHYQFAKDWPELEPNVDLSSDLIKKINTLSEKSDSLKEVIDKAKSDSEQVKTDLSS